MTQDTAAGQRPDVTLIALSVVLVADNNNIEPSMVNPDFLRHSGIVDPGLQIEQPPVSTPVFSQVVFEGGLSVVVQPDRFDFTQRGEALTEDVAIPGIARRLLEKVPHPAYKAIGINPTGVRPLGDGSAGGVASALVEGGEWMAFGDVSPEIFLKALYPCEGRQITLEIRDVEKRESDGSESPRLLFAANIHRDISETIQERRIAKMTSILSGWRDDLSDFKNLVEKFNLGRTSS